ncbi:alpha/beta hydrolase [Halomonas sp. HMF6819]|uniref:alpha/beta hydrolase n=1 Tax=Halomonas sp. HMF6819 TaxID=3373085 RepID=UPI00379CA21E
MPYRDFATQEEIDRAYDTMQGRDPGQLAKAWLERSDVSRSRHRVTLDRAYGPSLAERMDIFHAEGPAAPVHIFYHGGFWRALSHREFSFVVDSLVAAGITVAVVNYALCPQVRFSELVRQNQAALAHIHRHADELQVDPNQLSISGHSAGGHICAMMVTTDWEGMFGLPADVIRGALCISGLFDLRPFPWSGLQPKLQLTGRDVEEFSPLWRSPCVQAPMHLVVGGQETEEFQRQTTAYARHLEQEGLSVELHLLEEDDHFSVLEHYLDGRFVDWIKAFHAL